MSESTLREKLEQVAKALTVGTTHHSQQLEVVDGIATQVTHTTYTITQEEHSTAVDTLVSALTQLSALERDHEAMEAIRDHVGCSLVDAGELFVWKNGRGPSGVGEIVRCEADPTDAILGTQEQI